MMRKCSNVMLVAIGFAFALPNSASAFSNIQPRSLTVGPSISSSSFSHPTVTSTIPALATGKRSTVERTTRKARTKVALAAEENNDTSESDTSFPFSLLTAITLVGGQSILIAVSVAIAAFLKVPNYGLGESFVINGAAIQTGALTTLPLFFIAYALDFVEDKVPALQQVTKATQRSVLAMMGGEFNFGTALLVSGALGAAAGIGEEMLFRGLLQTQLLQLPALASIPGWISVLITSIIFGALHAITPLYAIIATIASMYFGYLFLWTADSYQQLNLAIPIICHALYDVGALLWAHYEVSKMTRQEQIELNQWVPGSTASD